MDESTEQVLTPDEARRTLWMVWLLLLLSLPVYALFALVTPIPPEWDPAVHTSWEMVGLFGALGVATLVAIPLVRRWLFFGPLERGDIDRCTEEYLRELRIVSAATWALATSLSIYGLLAYFFVFQLWVFGVFFVPSLALFFVFRPPSDLIEEMEGPAGPYEG